MMNALKKKLGWKSWRVTELIQNGVLEIGDGYRAKNSEMSAIGLPFVRAQNVNQGLQLNGVDILGEASVKKAGTKVSRIGDVVLTTKGTFGRFAFVKNTTPKFIYSPQLCYWRVKDSSFLNPRFLYFWMQSSDCLDQMKQIKGLTDMADYVSLTNQRKMWLYAPELQTQNRIASILSAYDDLIENNTRRIQILEEMAQRIYKEWFVDFRFPGHEKVKFVDSELGRIPSGWEVKKLETLTRVVTKGTTPTTLGKKFQNEGINFFKVESIAENGEVIAEKLAKIDYDTHLLLKRSQIQLGDILFSIAGAIGRSTLVTERFLPANTNQALAIIRLSDRAFTGYLYQVIRAHTFLTFSLGRVVQTAQANVSLGVLKSAPILLPEDKVLRNYNEVMIPTLEMVEYLGHKNHNLRQTRDLLLPKLISGEIDVSDMPELKEAAAA